MLLFLGTSEILKAQTPGLILQSGTLKNPAHLHFYNIYEHLGPNIMPQIYYKTPGFYCSTCDPHLSGWLKGHVKLRTTGAAQSSWDTLVDMTCSTTMHQDLVRSFLLLLLMENICHHRLPPLTLKTGALKTGLVAYLLQGAFRSDHTYMSLTACSFIPRAGTPNLPQ